jgi:hypothetical protein
MFSITVELVVRTLKSRFCHRLHRGKPGGGLCRGCRAASGREVAGSTGASPVVADLFHVLVIVADDAAVFFIDGIEVDIANGFAAGGFIGV